MRRLAFQHEAHHEGPEKSGPSALMGMGNRAQTAPATPCGPESWNRPGRAEGLSWCRDGVIEGSSRTTLFCGSGLPPFRPGTLPLVSSADVPDRNTLPCGWATPDVASDSRPALPCFVGGTGITVPGRNIAGSPLQSSVRSGSEHPMPTDQQARPHPAVPGRNTQATGGADGARSGSEHPCPAGQQAPHSAAVPDRNTRGIDRPDGALTGSVRHCPADHQPQTYAPVPDRNARAAGAHDRSRSGSEHVRPAHLQIHPHSGVPDRNVLGACPAAAVRSGSEHPCTANAQAWRRSPVPGRNTLASETGTHGRSNFLVPLELARSPRSSAISASSSAINAGRSGSAHRQVRDGNLPGPAPVPGRNSLTWARQATRPDPEHPAFVSFEEHAFGAFRIGTPAMPLSVRALPPLFRIGTPLRCAPAAAPSNPRVPDRNTSFTEGSP